MKKLLAVLAVAVFAAGSVVFADVVTNSAGDVIEVVTLGSATNALDTSVIQDQSVYPTRVGEQGSIVRWYDFANNGGTAGAEIVLDPPIVIPSNTVVEWGYIQALTAFTPSTNTISLGLNTAVDLLAATTNLGVASKRALIPVGTVATMVQATNAVTVRLKPTGTITAGKAAVILKVSGGQGQ